MVTSVMVIGMRRIPTGSPSFSIYGDYFDSMCCVNSRGNVSDGNNLEVDPTTYSYGNNSPYVNFLDVNSVYFVYPHGGLDFNEPDQRSYGTLRISKMRISMTMYTL